ncbi:MAG: ComEA family DNA-binding protein [Acidimicrobiia bacterium]
MDRASTNLQFTVIGVAVLVTVGGLLWFGWPSAQAPVAESPIVAVVEADRLTVHVSGAVVTPGVVEVPGSARVADAVAAAGGATASAELGAMNLAAPLQDGDHIAVPSVGEANGGAEQANGIDLNTASASELEALPGVGPVLADRIVEFRDQHGRFASPEDLLDVPGIGEAKLSQFREEISSP